MATSASQSPSTPRPATSADVAKRAGVSRATVSYILNDKPGHTFTPETRAAVLQAAHDLAYQPNIAARGLIGGRSRLIGFLYDNPNYSYVTEAEIGALIAKAVAEAEEQGITGAAITPFLLGRIVELSDGASLRANIALVKHNAELGAAIAVAYAG